MKQLLILITALWGASAAVAQSDLRVEQVAGGFSVPWALGFLPDGSSLVTEREGRLWRVNGAERHQIKGVGPVADIGQGGLLDILIPRDFESSRDLYFTLARQQGTEAGTAVARARLSADARQLIGWTVIYEIAAGSEGGRHFGSRLAEGPDGTLFVTVGDRGESGSAQDLTVENGSVLRLNRDGTIPSDNPFWGRDDARAAIWSYGHRNPQGAGFGADGRLWVSEHGARGGDEVNLIQRGANYGWPVISYGRHYSGAKIGEGTAKPGLQQPVHYWDPSIAPSGLLVYSGRLWPEWAGHIFVGSLKFDYISRLDPKDPGREAQQIQTPETDRVRDVQEAPDGSIWFLSEGHGAVFRITRP